jgi:hypothetical protein
MSKILGKTLFSDIDRREYEQAGNTGHTIGTYLRHRNANFTIVLAEMTGLEAHVAWKRGVTAEGSFEKVIHGYCAIDDAWAIDALGIRNLKDSNFDYGKPSTGDGYRAHLEHIYLCAFDCLDDMVKGCKSGKLTRFVRGEKKLLRAYIKEHLLPQLDAHRLREK